MKLGKILVCLLVIWGCVGLLTACTDKEDLFGYTVLSDGVRIDDVRFADAIIVPEQIEGQPVVEIGESAFYQNTCTSVTLPSSLQTIGESAFYRCHNIKQITVPAGTTCMMGNPFFRCSGLETVTVEPGNSMYCDIDGVLFDAVGQTLLAYPEGRQDKTYQIPQGVTQIAAVAFGYATNLETLIIPESVVTFPDYNLFEITPEITLQVTPGSAAESYATQHGLSVEYAK